MIDEKLIVTPALLRRFELEGQHDQGTGAYSALLQVGHATWRTHTHHGPSLSMIQQLWAQDVLRLLNRECHHGGVWVICFTHPAPVNTANALLMDGGAGEYGRYAIIWLDQDGDPQFTMEWSRGAEGLIDFAAVIAAGIESTANKAETCWRSWCELMVDLIERTPAVTYKRAQGEVAPSLLH